MRVVVIGCVDMVMERGGLNDRGRGGGDKGG